jgi:hypothetical protein
MITLSGQRFVGASQAGETRGERSKRVNHAVIFSLHSQTENHVTRRGASGFASAQYPVVTWPATDTIICVMGGTTGQARNLPEA